VDNLVKSYAVGFICLTSLKPFFLTSKIFVLFDNDLLYKTPILFDKVELGNCSFADKQVYRFLIIENGIRLVNGTANF